jgi:UDP-glucuronate decarboxylase
VRVLVAGGAGFIGSHLVDSLLEHGDEVTIVDNFVTGHRNNIAQSVRSPRCSVIDTDLSEALPPSVARLQVDRIYQLASPASPVHFTRNPVATLLVNALGTRSLLELARRSEARLLLASTSEVYGDPLIHPQTESYWGNVNPLGPRSCYDEGKRFAESLCIAYHSEFGVDVRIARIFNTYGPRSAPADGRVIPNFCVQALSGSPLTVHGNGAQTRSFCYVSDIVRGLRLLMEAPGLAAPVVNLGSTQEVTVAELAARVIAAAGSRSGIVHEPRPTDDPAKRRPDIRRAREILGWEPEVSFVDGIRATLNYFQLTVRSDVPPQYEAETDFVSSPGTARMRGPGAIDGGEEPVIAADQVSVVICVYTQDRWDDICAAIASVQAQTVTPAELIVAVDHNDELSRRLRSAATGVRVIDSAGPPGKSGALNTAVSQATGRVIALLDDDAAAEPGWLETLVSAYSDDNVLGVGGYLAPRWSSERPRWFPAEFYWVFGCSYTGLPTRRAAVRNLIGANMSFRRDVFVSVGGSHVGMGPNGTALLGACRAEDTEFCVRASLNFPSGRWVYEPQAVVVHHVPLERATWKYFRSRCYSEGISKAMLARIFGGRQALARERAYTYRILPAGIVGGVADAIRRADLHAAARAGAIVAGLAFTIAGYAMGMVATRGHGDAGDRSIFQAPAD